MPKVSYPSMESILVPILRYIKTTFSACTLTDLTTVHFLPQNCTPVLFPIIQSCFSITQLKNLNCIIDWNVSISNSTSTSTGWTMWILTTCQRELYVWCPILGASLCHSILMSVHWASQITSEKQAILDCNCFIKSTTNWYPEVSKEPFYCILQILSKFTQLATISQIRLYLIYLKLIYGKLSHIKFLSHINYIIPLPEVQSTSRPFDGFLTCVQRNKELVIMTSSRIMMSLLWHQSSWSPVGSLFPP